MSSPVTAVPPGRPTAPHRPHSAPGPGPAGRSPDPSAAWMLRVPRVPRAGGRAALGGPAPGAVLGVLAVPANILAGWTAVGHHQRGRQPYPAQPARRDRGLRRLLGCRPPGGRLPGTPALGQRPGFRKAGFRKGRLSGHGHARRVPWRDGLKRRRRSGVRKSTGINRASLGSTVYRGAAGHVSAVRSRDHDTRGGVSFHGE
jgi:hypothetical protein